jgi:phosphatidylserine/phosphatidylglycerophosphate/cardiolipin synthase-like enzyme
MLGAAAVFGINMANDSSDLALFRPRPCNRRSRRRSIVSLAAAMSLFAAVSATAQDRPYFPAVDNAQAEIVRMINAEQERLDIATWYLNDGEIAQAIVNKHLSGITVRVIGDRGSIFEADPNTRAWFEYLARNGVPIRLRYHPTWFPFIIHWKCGIFKGQRTVEFGSANWTTDELVRFSPTNFKDETALFSSDLTLVNAFLTKFDQYWADTADFLDWKDAYLAETGQQWTAPYPAINRARREPDGRDAPGMVWSQGDELTSAMLAEINRETQAIDMVIYRLTITSITDALIAKHRAGVKVRIIIEPTQYRNRLYPEYEMTGANIDRLWAAGIKDIKQRQHEGLTHMKTLITSNIALNASSNFTTNWERDHNYFISAQAKPALWSAFKNRFNAMWNDGVNYVPFQPQNPAPAPLLTPAISASNVPTTTKLEWNRAFWATSYDVYFGTSSGNPPFVGRVNAEVRGDPPPTYSWTPPQPLQPNTAYYWKVISRTFATDDNPAIAATSEFWGFTTAGSGSGGLTPFGSAPVALPGTIQAENFDNGGANVAYVDTSSGNSGGAYRNNTDVDIEGTTGGGNNVGWIATGEWLKYTVNVATAGAYTLEFRVASSGGGGTFHVESGTQNISGPINIPNTGGWQTWTTVQKTGVNLSAGQQVWTVRFDAVGTGGAIGNLDWMRVTSGGTSPPPPALPTLPGTLQAEDFDTGAQNVAYLDNSPGNTGGQYRTTDVDIERTSDTAGDNYNVGWAFAGEWLRYTVNVTTAGTYDIEFRVASGGAGGTFHVAIGGVNRTGSITVPNTGGWQTWTTVRATGVTLAAGQQVWQLVMATNGATTAVGNFNWIRVVAAGSSPPPPPPPTAPEIVIYGSDVLNANLHGNWTKVTDATAAGNTRIASADRAAPTVSAPLAAPGTTADYFDATFSAVAGVRYGLWLRMSAAANNKLNDSVWVQFSGSTDSGGNQRYRIGTTQGLNVNLATCADCALSGWGWQNRGYWEPDTGEIWFSATGTQTIRIQIREDGVSVDQIVLSPQRFVNSAPGPPTGDTTIVPK